jgi:uncharacterized protein (DUF1330 family)
MAVYVISDVAPQDPQAWETYIKLAPATIEKYGGRYLARGGDVETMEGTWAPKAIVLVEFPNADAVKAWYASPEYAQALKVRDKALRRNLICVEGVAAPPNPQCRKITKTGKSHAKTQRFETKTDLNRRQLR